MNNEWYYGQHDQQLGPVSIEELKALAAAGQLARTDIVWIEGFDDWIPAAEVEGLSFPMATGAKASSRSEKEPITFTLSLKTIAIVGCGLLLVCITIGYIVGRGSGTENSRASSRTKRDADGIPDYVPEYAKAKIRGVGEDVKARREFTRFPGIAGDQLDEGRALNPADYSQTSNGCAPHVPTILPEPSP